MEFAGYIASLLMGVTLGLLGGGGSILTVPILVYFFDIIPTTATGYSLFVVGVTALVGSFSHYRRGDVSLQTGAAFAIPSMLGVVLSRTVIVPSLPETIATAGAMNLTRDALIMMAFACLMVLASWSMIRRKGELRTDSSKPRPGPATIIIQGFLVGVVAGFVGAGGGFLIVPALAILIGLGMRVAVGTSLVIIAFQSILGFVGDLAVSATVNWRLLLSVAMVAIFGIIAGSSLSSRLPETKLKKAFGWFVLVMGAGILIEQMRHLT